MVYILSRGSSFTEEQLTKLLDVATGRDLLFLKTLMYTGARISEIVGNDLDEKPDPLIPSMINVQFNSIAMRNLKSKKFRRLCTECKTNLKKEQMTCFCGSRDIERVPLPKRWKEVEVPGEFIQELLADIQRRGLRADEAIFGFSRVTGYRIVKFNCLKAGFEPVWVGSRPVWPHPHNLRHTLVMQGLRKNVALPYIQKQTGHSNIAMLGEYMEVLEAEKGENLKKMWDKEKKD